MIEFIANLTLRKKITLLIMLGLALGVGILSFVGMRAVNQATETMLRDRLTTAQLVAGYVDDVLNRALTELRSTAEITGDGAGGNLQSQVVKLEDTYSRLSIYIYSTYLLNQQGQIIWSRPEAAGVEGYNISFYPGIRKTLETGKANISGLVLAPVTNTPVILLTSLISKGQQGSNGVLVVAVDLAQSSIGGFVQPIRLGETGYVELVDQDGVVVARTEPGPELSLFERSDHSGRFAALIAAGKPARGLCHTCHEPVERVERKDVLAFVPLSIANWGVVIRQSEEEALAPVYELRRNLLIFAAGLVPFLLLFVVVTTRDVVNRIQMLTAASRRIARGDLVSLVPTAGKDDLGVLAQTFEEMRLKLQSSYGELERMTKELSSLLSISEVLTSLSGLSNLDTVLSSVLSKTLEIIEADSGGILLLEEGGQVLVHRAAYGLSGRYAQEARFRLGEGITGKAVETGETFAVEDISMDYRAAHPRLIAAEGIRGFVSVPLRSKDKILGAINISSHRSRRFSSEEIKLLESIAAQIAVALDNAQLHQEVQRKEEVRGELLHEILTIQEEERRRIARELHDETAQILASLNASLEAAAGLLPAGGDKAKAMLKKAQALSINILDGIHKLIYELRPSLLDDLGLVAATRWLVNDNLRAAGIKVTFKVKGDERRLPSRVETALFRVVQEAVVNIVRHAHARKASVDLCFDEGAIRVRIRDDGRGFDVREAISSKDRPRGLGLLGMKERIELVNGALSIRSQRDGGGTEIDINIPINYQEVSDAEDKDNGGG